MAEYALTAKTPLAGFAQDTGAVRMAEVTDRVLMSLACPSGGAAELDAVAQALWQCALPPVGTSVLNDEGVRLLGLQPDQWWVLAAATEGASPLGPWREQLGAVAHMTDQSDAWVMLRVSGAQSRKALERICMLDLHPANFGPGKASRTLMEHLGVVLCCEAEGQYLLLGARSSADSLLHALQVSARHIA
ncbi:MAG: sarcosine oxidase subunit gamma family protein [Thiolinea sp.]